MTYRTWLKKFEKTPKWPDHGTIVSVVWDDATYAQEVEDSGLARATTLGIVVEATEAYIKTAAEFFADKTLRDITTIPTGMIVAVHPLGDAKVPDGKPQAVTSKRR